MNQFALLETEHETPSFRRLARVVEKAYQDYSKHMVRLPVFNDFADDFLYYFNSHLHDEYEELGADQELLYYHVRDALMNRRYTSDKLFPQNEVW